MDELRREVELAKLRRMKEARDLEELESIKSEENPYSSGTSTPIEITEEILRYPKPNSEAEELYRKLAGRQYAKLRERLGDNINEGLVKLKESLNVHMRAQLEYLENKGTHTEGEERELRSLSAEDLEKERKESLMECTAIHLLYQQYFKKEDT